MDDCRIGRGGRGVADGPRRSIRQVSIGTTDGVLDAMAPATGCTGADDDAAWRGRHRDGGGIRIRGCIQPGLQAALRHAAGAVSTRAPVGGPVGERQEPAAIPGAAPGLIDRQFVTHDAPTITSPRPPREAGKILDTPGTSTTLLRTRR